jgi:predicted nucleic acid-binding protein
VVASTIHLDTSFLIRALVPGSAADRQLRQWLQKSCRLAMVTIAWTEFLCGPLKPGDHELAERIITERIAYSEQDALRAAEFFNKSGRRRGSMIDCVVAAAACGRSAALATLNLDDFQRFEGLGLRLV